MSYYDGKCPFPPHFIYLNQVARLSRGHSSNPVRRFSSLPKATPVMPKPSEIKASAYRLERAFVRARHDYLLEMGEMLFRE